MIKKEKIFLFIKKVILLFLRKSDIGGYEMSKKKSTSKGKRDSYVFDTEWVNLILEARAIGLTTKEVKKYIQTVKQSQKKRH